MDRPAPVRRNTKPALIEDGETINEYFARYYGDLRGHISDMTFAVLVWGGGVVITKDEMYQDYDLPMGTIRVMNEDGTFTDTNALLP